MAIILPDTVAETPWSGVRGNPLVTVFQSIHDLASEILRLKYYIYVTEIKLESIDWGIF